MKVKAFKIGNTVAVKGIAVSSEGVKYGYLDYACIREMLEGCILNNNIINAVNDFECINDADYDAEYDEYRDVYQMYIVSKNDAELLQDFGEIVYYSEELDLYLWGVTHLGTSWDYVLSDVRLNIKEVG